MRTRWDGRGVDYEDVALFSDGGKKCVALIKSDTTIVVAERNYERCAAGRFIPDPPSCCLFPAATYFFCSCTPHPALSFYSDDTTLRREEQLLGNYLKQMTSKF